MVQSVLGTFDSLNPLVVRGLAARSIRNYVIESLMTRNYDALSAKMNVFAGSVTS